MTQSLHLSDSLPLPGTVWRHTAARLGQGLVDGAMVAVVFVAPLFLGGRHPLGHLVYAALAATAASGWLLQSLAERNSNPRLSPLDYVWLASIALLFVQLVPWPRAWLHSVVRADSATAFVWADAAEGGIGWSTISLLPAATRQSLVLLLAHFTFFHVAARRYRTRDDRWRLCRLIAWSTCWLAALGLMQYFGGNGRFLWWYQHPSRSTDFAVKGPFINENHFAHLLALGLAAWAYWCWTVWNRCEPQSGKSSRSPHPWTRWMLNRPYPRRAVFGSVNWSTAQWSCIAGTVVIVAAGLLTYSRGGVLAIGVCVTVLFAAIWRIGLITRSAALRGCLLLGVLLAVLMVHGGSRLWSQLGTLTDWNSAGSVRLQLWSAAWHGWQDHRWFGTGVGSHAEVYPSYIQLATEVEYTHAESGYLQVALECGAAGLLVLMAALLLALRTIRRLWTSSDNEHRVLAATLASAGLVSVTHSLVDFVWYVPACTVPLCLLFAIGQSAADHRPAQSAAGEPIPDRLQLLTVNGLMRLGLVFMMAVLPWVVLGPPARASLFWDRYLRRQLREDSFTQRDIDQERHWLQRSVRAQPDHARAHFRLAQWHLQAFDRSQQQAVNAMPLAQIRDAAMVSQFPSTAKLNAWLDVAVGPARQHIDQALSHVRAGLQHSPLCAQGYLQLAELGFLIGHQQADKLACLQRALQLRPFDGDVLLTAGNEAALAGDFDTATRLWRTAYHRTPTVRAELHDQLGQRVSVDQFVRLMRPDLPGLRELYQHHRRQQNEDAWQRAGQWLLAALSREVRTNSQNVDCVSEAADVAHDLGQTDASVAFAYQVLNTDVSRYRLRVRLIRDLMHLERWAEAHRQFQWCNMHRPGDPQLAEFSAEFRAKANQAIRR